MSCCCGCKCCCNTGLPTVQADQACKQTEWLCPLAQPVPAQDAAQSRQKSSAQAKAVLCCAGWGCEPHNDHSLQHTQEHADSGHHECWECSLLLCSEPDQTVITTSYARMSHNVPVCEIWAQPCHQQRVSVAGNCCCHARRHSTSAPTDAGLCTAG